MIIDYISQQPIRQVELFSDGAFLNKNITEIKSMTKQDETIGYQSIQIYVPEAPGTEDEIKENFDLVWKAYEEGKYVGNILTDPIETVMNFWHAKNLINFETFLAEHPFLYADGNYYGVEEVDRNEMTQQFLSYQIEVQSGLNPTGIEWHDKKKACKELSLEDFLALTLAIKQYTLPYYNLMQSRKETIFNCTEKIDVFDIPITYEIIDQNNNTDETNSNFDNESINS